MDKQTKEKVFRVAYAAVLMHTRLKELVTVHPDDTPEDAVIPASQIEEIIDEFVEKAYNIPQDCPERKH
jgi:hypothetical protein